MTVKVKRGRGTLDITFSLNNKRDMKKLDRWLEEAGKDDSAGLVEAAEKVGIIPKETP